MGTKQKTLLPLLFEWAERVYPMDEEIAEKLDELGHAGKTDDSYMVGPDDWYTPGNPELVRRLRDLIEAHPPE